MAKTPTEIFKVFDDKELLVAIANNKNLEVTDSFRKNIVKNLAKYVTTVGLQKILSLINYDELKELAEGLPSMEDGKAKPAKATLVKRLFEHMQDVGVSKFLQTRSTGLMDKILEKLDTEAEAGHQVEAFLEEADQVGLEYLFSSFPKEQLRAFTESCDLKCSSDSRDILIQCLTQQTNHKNKTKKRPEPKPSKHKPDIKKGINKVDLNHHYSREELSDWCKDHKLTVSGNKREIIQRILDHLAGIVATKKRKAPGGKKRASPAKKKAKKSSSQKTPTPTKKEEEKIPTPTKKEEEKKKTK